MHPSDRGGNPVPAGHPPDLERIQATPESMIHHHWEELHGAPGDPIRAVEAVGPPSNEGHRIVYKDGVIYLDEANSRPAWVRGDILARYDALGGPRSALGFPTSDEADFDEAGRISKFQHGNIYWWPGVGAIEFTDVVIKYSGILCFGNTDWDGGSSEDEPYVVLGTVSSQGTTVARSRIYDGVKAIQGRSEELEIYRGAPFGVTVTALLMEHDDDDPDKYKERIHEGVTAAFGAITGAAGAATGGLGGILVGAALTTIEPLVTNAINNALDLKDDKLGQETWLFTPKELIAWAATKQPTIDYGVRSNYQTPLFNGEGSSYKVCFIVERA